MRKLPTPARSMEDESGSAPASGSKRKQVSKRSFLARGGAEADTMEDAAGARYTLLGDGGGDHDYTFGENPQADRMFAIFGFHTKIGNVANTVLNDKDEPGTPADAGEAIKEFLALVASGTWAEKREGGGGARIDKDALAAAVVEVAASKGQTKDMADVREKLEDNPGLVRKLRANDEIAAAYAKRVGKAPVKTEDVLGLI